MRGRSQSRKLALVNEGALQGRSVGVRARRDRMVSLDRIVFSALVVGEVLFLQWTEWFSCPLLTILGS